MKIELVEILETDQIKIPEVKRTLRMTGTGHDGEIKELLNSARVWVEKTLDTTIGKKSWKVTSECEYDEYDLPRGPVLEITDEDTDDDDNNVYEYEAGFDDGVIPDDIKRLIILVCKRNYDIDDISEGLNKEIQRLIFTNSRKPLL